MKGIKLLFTMFLLFAAELLVAQNFEWLKTYGTQTKTSNSLIQGICSKENGNSIILVNEYPLTYLKYVIGKIIKVPYLFKNPFHLSLSHFFS